MSTRLVFGIPAFLMLCGQAPAAALAPAEILVVVNARVAAGRELAEYYMHARGVPAENLVAVPAPSREVIRRVEYDETVAAPIRGALVGLAGRRTIRCLLLMLGMPLRVLPAEPSPEEIGRVEAIGQQKRMIAAEIEQRAQSGQRPLDALNDRLAELNAEAARLAKADQSASLDSELALVASGPYPLSGWVPNPFFLPFRDSPVGKGAHAVLLVGRLDGPDPAVVRRLIDDALAAEAAGIAGGACFDARWRDSPEAPRDAYGLFDRSIHRAAALVRQDGRLSAAVEETEALFQPGQCPEAVFYCGWYSLGRYVDAFDWKPGAVGYHIASSECVSLRTPGNTQWCQRMLEKGVAATIGPVEEPYVQAFPLPELFFGLLLKGELTLVECYAASTPFLSWRMVLIGDPLYRPFAKSAEIRGAASRGAFSPPVAETLGERRPPPSKPASR